MGVVSSISDGPSSVDYREKADTCISISEIRTVQPIFHSKNRVYNTLIMLCHLHHCVHKLDTNKRTKLIYLVPNHIHVCTCRRRISAGIPFKSRSTVQWYNDILKQSVYLHL